MRTAILLFDRLTALDAVGPYEVLRGLPENELSFVAAEPGPKPTDHGSLALVADTALEALTDPDLIVVPGGPGEVEAREDARVLGWLRAGHDTSQWTTSVCTGSLLLAAAGLLDGKRATTHWTALESLRELGAEPTDERVVFDGKVVTAAGVSSGIDMALALAARIAGDETAQAIQLAIEYDPQPPFDAGSTSTAPGHIVDALRRTSRFWAGAPAT